MHTPACEHIDYAVQCTLDPHPISSSLLSRLKLLFIIFIYYRRREFPNALTWQRLAQKCTLRRMALVQVWILYFIHENRLAQSKNLIFQFAFDWTLQILFAEPLLIFKTFELILEKGQFLKHYFQNKFCPLNVYK